MHVINSGGSGLTDLGVPPTGGALARAAPPSARRDGRGGACPRPSFVAQHSFFNAAVLSGFGWYEPQGQNADPALPGKCHEQAGKGCGRNKAGGDPERSREWLSRYLAASGLAELRALLPGNGVWGD